MTYVWVYNGICKGIRNQCPDPSKVRLPIFSLYQKETLTVSKPDSFNLSLIVTALKSTPKIWA
jgi:hypothetical protein